MAEVFGRVLKQLRKEEGLTQTQLADFCNTTKYTISAWELGKQEPDINTLLKLSDIFKVSVDYLLGKTH